MSLLDRFRQQPPPVPAKPDAPAWRPRGQSGRGHYHGFLALEELTLDLQGIRGLAVFDRMWRTDPDVRRAGAMVINPILGGTWSVEPHGGDDAGDRDRKAAKGVEWALFEHMRPRLAGHLAQFLPVLVRSGFAPGEQVWESAGWDGQQMLVPRTIGLRLPRTIHRWLQDDFGELTGIEQLLPTGAPGVITIPGDDLLYYRLGAEGDNWEGTSLLRPAYKPWYIKEKIEQLDAIAQEREATGIPVVFPPASGSDDDTLDDLEQKLADLKGGEAVYLMMPGPSAEDVGEAGWRFDVKGLGGGGGSGGGSRDAQPSLEYHSKKIAAAFIAEFMMLGQQQVGARATADVQQDPFLAGVEAIATVIEDALNDTLVPRITALNFDVDEPPRLRMSLVDSTSLEELERYVQGLIQAQALTPDHPLEDFLRDKADLPPADPAERERREQAREEMEEMRRQGLEPDKPDGEDEEGDEDDAARSPSNSSSNQPSADRQLARQERPLRPWEQRMELDTIEDAIEQARERFQQAAGAAVRALAADQAQVAERGRQLPRKPSEALVEALRVELADLYITGRRTVADELAAQRSDGAPPQVLARDDEPNSIVRRARLVAQAIVDRVAAALERLAVGGRSDLGELQAAGEREAGAALRAEAQLHAVAALNEGRSDEADVHADEIAGSRYTSILDRNRCGDCAEADDDVLRPLDDPVRVARRPPNPKCDGGSRCRCMEFYELREEVAPSGASLLDQKRWPGGAPWRPKGPAPGRFRGEAIGISPFRGRKGYTELEPVLRYFESPRFKGFAKRVQREAAIADLDVTQLSPAIGLWRGRWDPGVAVTLDGDSAAIRRLTRGLAAEYKQESVMHMRVDPRGPDFLYTLPSVPPSDEAKAALTRHGFDGGRFVEGRLEVADLKGRKRTHATALARDLGVQLEYTRVRVEFDQGPFSAE